MDILINVSKQRLKLATNLKKYVSGSQEFVRFVFGLNSYWRDLLTFAQFAQNGNTYNRYLDDENAVYLPSEIVAGECTLTLFGSGNSVIATTNYLTLTIDENILVSDASSTDISESLYEQLVDMVRSVSNGTAVVDAKNKMIDKNKIYVYIGSETGMTNGNWYYWNGTAWTSGGVWNAVAVETDKTLSVENKAADGKAAGSLVEVGNTQPTSTANKIWINPTDEEIEIPEMGDLNAVDAKVDNLKSDLSDVNNLEMKKVFETTNSSAVIRIEISFDPIPAGTQVSIDFDNIQSSDTDDTMCLILIGDSTSDWNISQKVSRDVPFVLNSTFSHSIDYVWIYAATTYPKGTNDTVTITNFSIKKENKITNFANSAVGGKTNSYGARTELYSSGFALENRVRTAHTVFANYHLQSCIYVAEKGLYYIAGSKGDGNSVLVSIENFNLIDNPLDTLNLAMGHCNDMTYNDDNGLIYVAHGGDNRQEGSVTRNGVHVINPSDFSDNYEIIISDLTEVYAIEYYEGFFYVREGYSIYKYKLVNNSFIRVGFVSEIPVASIISSVCGNENANNGVYQTITIRNDILYFLIGAPSGSNKANMNNTLIVKIDLNSGKTVGIIAFKNWNFSECESLIFIDENAYVISAQRTYFIDIYKTNIFATYSDKIGYKILDENTDLNSVLAYGKYVCDGSAIKTLMNAPSGISDALDILVEVKQYNLTDTIQKITAIYTTKPVAEYNRTISSTGIIYGWV